ncbi:MAG: hypothetical protein WA183_00535, partial [Chthoniobacterales bacterium]
EKYRSGAYFIKRKRATFSDHPKPGPEMLKNDRDHDALHAVPREFRVWKTNVTNKLSASRLID